MNIFQLQQAIKVFAYKLGFHDIGFCSLISVESVIFHAHQKWIENNYHGQMQYMATRNAERFNPSVLAGFEVRSVIAVIMNYYHYENNSLLANTSYCISRYALGRDYHKIFRKRMNHLAEIIRQLTGKMAKPYVDTSPVLEKYWAARCGLGVIGQNTCLIHHKYGSWIFIGIIYSESEVHINEDLKINITDLKCQECGICIQTCPTKAIVKPYTLNSNLCISYLTVEHKTNFDSQTPKWKKWIWGCDICQLVCPHNKNSKNTNIKDFLARPAIIELLNSGKISENKLIGTALKRGGNERLPRNINWVESNK